MQDQRAFPRHRVEIPGKLISPHSPFSVDCRVANLSQDGALVTASLEAALPKRLYLWQAETGTLFQCEVRWQRQREIGLRFVDVAGRPWRAALIERCCASEYARSRIVHREAA
jgi:hypothetical protein